MGGTAREFIANLTNAIVSSANTEKPLSAQFTVFLVVQNVVLMALPVIFICIFAAVSSSMIGRTLKKVSVAHKILKFVCIFHKSEVTKLFHLKSL